MGFKICLFIYYYLIEILVPRSVWIIGGIKTTLPVMRPNQWTKYLRNYYFWYTISKQFYINGLPLLNLL